MGDVGGKSVNVELNDGVQLGVRGFRGIVTYPCFITTGVYMIGAGVNGEFDLFITDIFLAFLGCCKVRKPGFWLVV